MNIKILISFSITSINYRYNWI